MKCKFHPGDQVCIRPDWWDHLANSRTAGKLYVQNGKDYVYTVESVDGYTIYLNGTDRWDEYHLIPAEEADPDEEPLTGLMALL